MKRRGIVHITIKQGDSIYNWQPLRAGADVRPIVSWLVAILCGWLWASFVAPAAIRSLGIPMVSGWQLIRSNRYLSRRQYIWGCGVLAVGSGLFWFLTIRPEMFCLLTVNRFVHQSGVILAVRLILCMGAGWFFGLITAQSEMSDFILR
jgi:hypothetical protein